MIHRLLSAISHLAFQLALQFTHISKTAQLVRIAVLAAIKGQLILFKHALKQAYDMLAILEYQPVSRAIISTTESITHRHTLSILHHHFCTQKYAAVLYA